MNLLYTLSYIYNVTDEGFMMNIYIELSGVRIYNLISTPVYDVYNHDKELVVKYAPLNLIHVIFPVEEHAFNYNNMNRE